MKENFERGNVEEIVQAFPERNLSKDEDLNKDARRMERCLHFLVAYLVGESELYPDRVYTSNDIAILLHTVINGKEISNE